MKWSLFTPRCVLCHDAAAADGLCAGCLNDLSALHVRADEVCPHCAACGAEGLPCADCCRKPPPFAHFWASAYYAAPLPAMLHQWKHLRRNAFFHALYGLMRRNPPPWLPRAGIDGVLAMPVSRARRLHRGFNQSGELAAALAAEHALPLVPHRTVFRRAAPPQSTLNAAQRAANIQGAFTLKRALPCRHVLLIDDVYTTGSSLRGLADCLNAAGIRCSAWVLARHGFRD